MFRFIAFIVILFSSGALAEFYTIRNLDRSGRAYKAQVLVFTPDSKHLVFSSKKGVVLVAVDGGDIRLENPNPAFTIAFTRDSKQMLMASGQKTQTMNLTSGATVDIPVRLPPGFIGLKIDEDRGKLIVTSVTNSPSEKAGIETGGELVAIHEQGYTFEMLGKSVEKSVRMLKGPAGTYVGVSIIPKGKRKRTTYRVLRQRGEGGRDFVRFLPAQSRRVGAPTTIFKVDKRYVLLDALDGSVNSIITPESIDGRGLRTTSHDGKYFAAVGNRLEKGRTECMIEVFDTATRKLIFSIPFDDGYARLRFSRDNKYVLVGSHDCVYVLDVTKQQYIRRINFGRKPTLRSEFKGGDDRDEPTGWWFTKPAERAKFGLDDFDVSREGVLVTAAPYDGINLWDVKTGEKIRELMKGKEWYVDAVEFSPNGKWIAYYNHGELTLETTVPDPDQ